MRSIKRILREALLREGLSERLYHFTRLKDAVNIVKEDCLQASTDKDSGYRPYVSFTRCRNIKEGFPYFSFASYNDGGRVVPKGIAVRFEVDGGLIGSKYSGRAYDDFSRDGAKAKYSDVRRGMESPKMRYAKDLELEKYPELNKVSGGKLENVPFWAEDKLKWQASQHHMEFESEDRVNVGYGGIEDLHRYVVRVDIMLHGRELGEDYIAMIRGILNSPKYGGKTYIYDSERDFTLQTNNTVNGRFA